MSSLSVMTSPSPTPQTPSTTSSTSTPLTFQPRERGSSSGSSTGGGHSNVFPKQLHPSEQQLAAEAEQGIAGDPATLSAIASINGGVGTTSVPPVLAAPKPLIIETPVGPVSPKISPRTLHRSRSPATRSPAYSATNSPRSSSSRSIGGGGNGGSGGGGVMSNAAAALNNSTSGMVMGGVAESGMFQPQHHERRSSSGGIHSPSPGPSSSSASSPPALGAPQTTILRRGSLNKPLLLHTGSNTALQSLLARHTVASISSPRPVIELPSNATCAEGFELLLKHNILSCPVYDATKTGKDGNERSYIGFLDVRDLVSSIVFAHEEQQLALNASFNDRWNELMLKGMQRFGTSVSVPYLSRRHPFKPMTLNATLLQVARALATHVHRVPIIDESGRCIRIVSQSSLIAFLHQHRDGEVVGAGSASGRAGEHDSSLAQELRQTIGSIGLGLCKVISVNTESSAWHAFRLIDVNNVSGIAIVDKEGRLVGNTSARDLKYFVLNRGQLSLDAPIQLYLSCIRLQDEVKPNQPEVHPSCSVGTHASIGHVIGLMEATGYHRVFIVDAQNRPVGVCSVTDILRFVVAEMAASRTGTTTPTPTSPPRS